MQKIAFSAGFMIFLMTNNAFAMMAFLIREDSSPIFGKKVCVYNYQGHEVGYIYPATTLCPLSVNID